MKIKDNVIVVANDKDIPKDYTGFVERIPPYDDYYEFYVDGKIGEYYGGTYFYPCRIHALSGRAVAKHWWTALRDHPKAGPILMAFLLGSDG
jgi:hypothetical protein